MREKLGAGIIGAPAPERLTRESYLRKRELKTENRLNVSIRHRSPPSRPVTEQLSKCQIGQRTKESLPGEARLQDNPQWGCDINNIGIKYSFHTSRILVTNLLRERLEHSIWDL